MRLRAVFISTLPAAALALVVVQAAPSFASSGPQRPAAADAQVSTDPFTGHGAEHATEVEPDTAAAGRDVASVFQAGRINGGCSNDMGWAFSSDAGKTWQHGFMPGMTAVSTPTGPFQAVSDPVVAWNAKFKEWVASALDCASTFSVSVNTSANGTTWTNPTIVAKGNSFDKDWVACDNTSSSKFFGNCYVEWDLPGQNLLVDMSTSTDGGKTWSAPAHTSAGLGGIGGEPVVLPNGNVVVTIFSGSSNSIVDFISTDGGKTWGATHKVASLSQHGSGGGLRGPGFQAEGMDAKGKVYLTWPDCRFRSGCTSNDMVMTTSTDGVAWTKVVRIPIDPVSSSVDHLGGGLGVDPSTSGSSAHLGLYYYYYPTASCTKATCKLFIGYVSSTNGGATWSAPLKVAGPSTLSQVAPTSQGPMVGDYVGAATLSGGNTFAAMAVGLKPAGGKKFNEPMEDVTGGEPAKGGSHPATSGGAHVFGAHIPRIVR